MCETHIDCLTTSVVQNHLLSLGYELCNVPFLIDINKNLLESPAESCRKFYFRLELGERFSVLMYIVSFYLWNILS